ncbi:MAG: plasmid stabilization protein [Candidatus Fluviicola riflensis]|nr:MAG: plasmid stabilization protein [Candidatus Fluviicola riflensis]OGS78892.1 MAG: plasmid stabilization protein [Candidatus Fluviicola riflensis]OGS85914.1 MAG: plasmid stabilization protein [Fluviicola sp. RIFCSPHIGHO2_12_FULL_43_24]OGS86323.1 MAG: plasmid stabilization protein [Fluviicola sp. RIFCSPHIGHO2_01_FULL_43_53]
MVSYKFTKEAILDLSEIWNYTIETWSEKQADKYYGLIINECNLLAKSPELGRSYFEVYPGLFGQKIAKHIIFYRRLDHSTIEIARILHEIRDLNNELNPTKQ